LADAMKKLEGAVSYGDDASKPLADAQAALRCSPTPADPKLSGRVWQLAGALAAADGQNDAATEDFRRAHLRAPAMVWDDNLAPAGEALWKQAIAAANGAPKVALTIWPDGAVTVDGIAWSASSVAPGDHDVIVGGLPLTLDVTAPSTLVVPAAFPADALAWASDPARRPALSSLLAVTAGEGTPVAVDTVDGIWTGTAGRSDWTLHPTVVAKRHHTGRAVMWTGAALTVAAAIPAVITYAQAGKAAHDQTASTSLDDWTAASQRYDHAVALFGPLRFVPLVGVAVAAGGLGLQLVAAPEGVTLRASW
jgi:hypothetical protein